ncbi:phage head morphogenesis protein [Actinobacillus capsulatus]|uniref:phage head morphogenesis protein n=1 Tax=Actinobacillus capsulatus TaxID=717 RepID=UPI0003788BAF|nr:phage head morphogenesis protein [Actinobacillus capsulatus]
MPTNDLNMRALLHMEPKVAVDYIKAKGYAITWNWQEALEDAHARAFTVAKVTRMDILETIRTATVEAIEKGIPEREYINDLRPKLEALGWWGKTKISNLNGTEQIIQLGSPRRLKTILRTNKITAYHAARYAEQLANSDEQPYWQYLAIKDSRTRASHLALHEKVYRYDDPIWEVMYPPNGWHCRCRVRALSERRLKKQGLEVSQSNGKIKQSWALAGIDKATGEETHAKIYHLTTDKGTIKTDPGWSHNVGKSALGSDVALVRKILDAKNRDLRSQTIQAINNSEARHKAFENWVYTNLGKHGASNRYISAGIISEDIADKVAQLSGGEKSSQRLLVMTERSLAHANSPKHQSGGIGLTSDEYASLSRVIAQGSLVVLDKSEGHNNLIYFTADRKIKVVVDPTFNIKRLKPKEQVDAVINAYKVENYEDVLSAIKGGQYIVIKGVP